MEKVDVVIAGAGIAGSLMARDLARAGRSVIVVERKPRARMGHDWWDAISSEVFDQVGMAQPSGPELMHHAEHTTMYPPLETMSVVTTSPPGKLHIDRLHLAQRQLKYAEEAGARLMFETAVRGPLLDGGKATGISIRSKDGATDEIRARLTVDASGMAAAIRKHIPENPFFPKVMQRKDMFVTYREMRNITSDDKENMVVFGQNNGVRWINRSQPGLIDFFAGSLNYPGRVKPKEIVYDMIAKTPDAGDKMLRGGYGAPIPVRHCFDAFVAPGFLVCGDSACQCNPLDGSGMASSLRSAHYAAKAAVAALENDRLDVAGLWPYVTNYKRTQGALFVPYDAMQKFMISNRMSDLELLFRRGVIDAKVFWGTGAKRVKESTISKIAKLLRVADRPAFMMKMVKASNTGKALVEHYEEFPEIYDPKTFALWKEKKEQIFATLPTIHPDNLNR